jgi:hypothetical protein
MRPKFELIVRIDKSNLHTLQYFDFVFRRTMKSMLRVLCILLLRHPFITAPSLVPPADDVVQALQSACVDDRFRGERCPYAVTYDITTQLVQQWDGGDGAAGLWSNGTARIWWPSGVGLWAFAEYFHSINARGNLDDVESNELHSLPHVHVR